MRHLVAEARTGNKSRRIFIVEVTPHANARVTENKERRRLEFGGHSALISKHRGLETLIYSISSGGEFSSPAFSLAANGAGRGHHDSRSVISAGGACENCAEGRTSPLVALVLERDLELDPVALDLAILQHHVQIRHLGDAEVTQCSRGLFHRDRGRLLPGLAARANQLDNLVDAVSHSVTSFMEWFAGFPFGQHAETAPPEKFPRPVFPTSSLRHRPREAP